MSTDSVLGSGVESTLVRSGATEAVRESSGELQEPCPELHHGPLKAKPEGCPPQGIGWPPGHEKGPGDVTASSRPESHPREERTKLSGDHVHDVERVNGGGDDLGTNARSASAPGGAAALPCQNSNNSDKPAKRYRLKRIRGTEDFYKQAGNDKAVWRKLDSDVIQRFGMPTTAEAKAAFHLRLNVEAFVRHYGRNHCLFFTLTDEENLHPTLFARRWNNLLRRNGAWIISFIRTLEPQKQGRPHYHLLVAVPWDTRPDAFDWESFFACQEERTRNGPTARFRELRAKYKASAAPELVALWSHLRKVLPRYGLGRAEILPIRKGKEAISEYIGKYLEAGLILRRHSWKGCRRVEFDRTDKNTWLACTRVFAWHSPGATVWRSRVGELAAAVGASDMDALRRSFGPKWAYRTREAITQSKPEDWQTFLQALSASHHHALTLNIQ